MTSSHDVKPPAWQWLAAALGCGVGLTAAVLFVRLAGTYAPSTSVGAAREVPTAEDLAALGTTARITASGVTRNQRLPRMQFSVNPGERVNAEVPADQPIEAEFSVTFLSGGVHSALVGIELEGGSVIMMRQGRVILSTYASGARITRFTSEPETFGPRQQQITIQFRSDGPPPWHVRALWQPLEEDAPRDLPSEPAVVLPSG